MGGKGSGRGTIPNAVRNITHLKWEIVYVTKEGRLIHEKFRSIQDIKQHPDLEFLTSGKLHYYSTKRPTIKKVKRKIGTLEIKHIHEPLPKVENVGEVGLA